MKITWIINLSNYSPDMPVTTITTPDTIDKSGDVESQEVSPSYEELLAEVKEIRVVSEQHYVVDFFFVTVFFSALIIYWMLRPLMYFIYK